MHTQEKNRLPGVFCASCLPTSPYRWRPRRCAARLMATLAVPRLSFPDTWTLKSKFEKNTEKRQKGKRDDMIWHRYQVADIFHRPAQTSRLVQVQLGQVFGNQIHTWQADKGRDAHLCCDPASTKIADSKTQTPQILQVSCFSTANMSSQFTWEALQNQFDTTESLWLSSDVRWFRLWTVREKLIKFTELFTAVSMFLLPWPCRDMPFGSAPGISLITLLHQKSYRLNLFWQKAWNWPQHK